MTLDVKAWLAQLRAAYPDLELLPPASPSVLDDTEKAVGPLPPPLRELLRYSNGLVHRSFRLYSAFDPRNSKKTWESLQRANDAAKTDALAADHDLLERFLVFADIGNGHAMLERGNGSIWFEESQDDHVRQTDLGFRDFLETMVRNAE
jgi:hypothetical protein